MMCSPWYCNVQADAAWKDLPVKLAMADELWRHVSDSALNRCLLCVCVNAAHPKISHL